MKEIAQSVPLNFEQPSLLIEHSLDGAIIPQRPRDGYINATHLCKKAGKRLNDYGRLESTRAFLSRLSAVTGIPATGLVQIIQGGNDKLRQGTWVHPRVAIHLGQWLSPDFAVQVSEWVLDWMQGKVTSYMPAHVQRYLKNKAKIPHDHFSMLNEIYLHLLAPLEDYGIVPTEKMMPDISTGRLFSAFLRQKGIDPGQFPTYEHKFTDDSRLTVQARLYPVEYLADFRRYFHEVWLPERAERYFKNRLPEALPLLPRLLALPPA